MPAISKFTKPSHARGQYWKACAHSLKDRHGKALRVAWKDKGIIIGEQFGISDLPTGACTLTLAGIFEVAREVSELEVAIAVVPLAHCGDGYLRHAINRGAENVKPLGARQQAQEQHAKRIVWSTR